MPERVIKINELTFSAAHYLKGHPKCNALHGHTYFVRNIEVLYDAPEGKFVDFSLIKAIVMELDHRVLIPPEDSAFWLHQPTDAPCKFPFIEIFNDTTVENIAEFLASVIKQIEYVKSVRLQVFEGPKQGAMVDL